MSWTVNEKQIHQGSPRLADAREKGAELGTSCSKETYFGADN